ncbi:CPBP family intramembrane glutamic endopeptidase [Chryseolinea sp. H1M3-3]|uniref:CPBP family intramembrane glutamic endopeptidase n=1 Tax=Chryseolinea sp. H1M3-3 TaxID=3034144 RepID=UPI0023ECFBB4|nr:CPBP family intramembrane glutamic endopeptidase [Chryseolinea sp. H1M3-3]
MKKIWKYLVQHIKEDFNAKQYSFVFVFVAVALFINYKFNFDDLVLKSQRGFTKFIYYFLFYATAYYVTLIIASVFAKIQFFRNKTFWIKSVVGLSALSLDSSVPFLRDWISELFDPSLQFWAYKVVVNLIGAFTVLLPLFVVYLFFDAKEKHYYGLHPKRFDTRPYFQMLMIMLPIMIAASFLPSFLKQYPMYKVSPAHLTLGVPEWVTVAIYEFAYGFDFITVEFLFRGFMVIGMINILGRHAVLAMAVTYCFLHTGKPLGEAISSIFGGYLLGVIAYETKSVWGGVIVHVGIAWMMEIIGFTQKSL